MRPFLRILIVSAMLAALVAPAGRASSVHAEDTWGFGPTPIGDGPGRDYFIYELAAGTAITDQVRLSNFTDRDLTFRIYARDAFSAPDGIGFAVQEYDDSPTGSGNWFELPPDADPYVLPAQTTADIPFRLSIPSSAEPGDYAGALVAELVDDGTGSDSAGVEVKPRIAARVYTRVSGELSPDMAFTQLDLQYDNSIVNTGSTATVTYALSNVGNTRLSPQISVVIEDVFGRTVATADLKSFSDILPGGTVTVTEVFEDVPPWIQLTAKVEAQTFGTAAATASASTSVWAVPWLFVIIVLVLLAVLVGLLVRRRRRRRRTS